MASPARAVRKRGPAQDGVRSPVSRRDGAPDGASLFAKRLPPQGGNQDVAPPGAPSPSVLPEDRKGKPTPRVVKNRGAFARLCDNRSGCSFLTVTLRCEAAKLPSLEGRRPRCHGLSSFEARVLGTLAPQDDGQ
jgi:hypothetical protein